LDRDRHILHIFSASLRRYRDLLNLIGRRIGVRGGAGAVKRRAAAENRRDRAAKIRARSGLMRAIKRIFALLAIVSSSS